MRLIDADLFESFSANYKGYDRKSYIAGAEAVLKSIDNAPTVDAVPAVHCKECCYWKDRKVGLPDGTERDYKPDEPPLITLDVGTNIGSHCTLHGFENESGSWFWSNADDFCSRGKRKGGEK